MFHAYHHRSAFPLIVVGLTLALLLGLAFLFGPVVREQSRGVRSSQGTSSQTYERNAGSILARMTERLNVAEDASARFDVLSTATSELLALVVPSSYQSIHLELITSLDLLRQGTLGDEAR